ncbi:hypothetical protein PLESTB_000526700 [Pleodorina starrii]|uniref:Uncharacterized protein n=1 Tax=Pleodorina starrii TaxID=330485 RepID=A0A9W6BH20_9CHLO|nr:hypothetical protein PLESTM_000390100 [Pleodorina starrii]GLC51665.1 hypothetical protein PLESTB_000526700 [Pleodorina starrii]GLC72433.1 hypothetical protein PLESTF_001247000 [Pleodorina starrii]
MATILLSSVSRPFTQAVLPGPRIVCRLFSVHPTGSKALDVLTAGGYPAGSIIELQGPDLKSCWHLAWLAAAAAYEQGWRFTACSGAACLDFGAERRLTDRDKLARTALAQPSALLDVVRCVERDCSLVLVDSWARIAEAAAPAGPDIAATRALRNRRLSTFLRQLSYRLLESQSGMPNSAACEGVGGSGASSSRLRRAACRKQVLRPALSILVCNTGQSGHDLVLQHHAALRLRVSNEPDPLASDVDGSRKHITVQLLKGPATNTRMPVPKTVVYTPNSSGTDSLSIADGRTLSPATMDLLVAGHALGLVVRQAAPVQGPGAEFSERVGAAPDKETGPASVGGSEATGFRYGDIIAATMPSLAARLMEMRQLPQLRQMVDEKLQAMSSPRPPE